MARSIIVDSDIGAISADHIANRYPNLDVREADEVTHVLRKATDSVALVVSNRTWRDKYLEGLSAGDWITTIGAGYDDFPIEAISRTGATFTNCPGINSEQVAEHVFGSVFAFTRQLWTYRDQQNAHTWDKHRWEMTDLSGDKCCILGLGSIGEAVAERAEAFGMEVHGIKRKTEGYSGSAGFVYSPERLTSAISGSRLLVLAVPLTDDTRGMIDREELDALSDDAIVVNVARGPILVTEALLTALRDGAIDAACLDVTDPEPLPEENDLWKREDVLITPHCAGSSDKYPERFVQFFYRQYLRWCAGRHLRHELTGQ